MDFRKLIKDILTWNTPDLRKRTDLLWRRTRRILFFVFHHGAIDVKEIPVIINNRNRLTYPMMLIDWLEKAGMKNIIIIDNASTYPPLLDYYQKSTHRVIRLSENIGPLAIWWCDELRDLTSHYYIYTDPDVLPDHSPGTQAFELMLAGLKKNLTLDKIGYALRIDDLPDFFALKADVIVWEEQFWKNKVDEHFFAAPVDTTFAMYAPFARGGGECKAYRTNFPFVAKHLPWYENSSDPGEENLYYRTHAAAQNSHWTNLMNIK
ncbi:MAG: hypothetical protein K1X54_00530 [Flavobacteriales bacterium]|nr:hypothetical protein [Flavobacteriales bacterium]